jgi:hypothetical protein
MHNFKKNATGRPAAATRLYARAASPSAPAKRPYEILSVCHGILGLTQLCSPCSILG